MVAQLKGAVLTGIDATVVDVECDLHSGLPAFNVVGLPDASVQEARERVRAAIRHAERRFPMCRITVNLAPSDVRKHGPALDLPVALGLLVAQGDLDAGGVDGRLFVGELGLAGAVRPVRGALAAAEAARRAGMGQIVCPADNAHEAALAGIEALPVRTLQDAIAIVQGRRVPPCSADAANLLESAEPAALDLAGIRGQGRAKHALEIAAAGGHNMLFTGPPGTGKTLLARALPGVLPRLTVEEALEVTRVHSAAGLLRPGEALVRLRPFRAPHHGVSSAGLIGGGSSFTRPGEVSLAHRGVLFLDELPEFSRACLEALRQPLEDGLVTIVRARHASTFPARVMFVAAMNPCPCGYRGSTLCRCTPNAIDTYRHRLSGPLLDRIDLHVEVARVEANALLGASSEETSSAVRERVEAARAFGDERGRRHGNAQIPAAKLLTACAPTQIALEALAAAARRHRLSARSIHRVLRVARTIADLDGKEHVEPVHVLEASTYRCLDVARVEDTEAS